MPWERGVDDGRGRKTVPLGTMCPRCEQVHSKCAAHPKNGELRPCMRAHAEGLEVCSLHGARVGHAKKAGERRAKQGKARAEIEQAMQALGAPTDVDPTEALLQLISWKYAEVVWLREKVVEADEAQSERGGLVWGEVEYSDKTGGEDWGTKRTERAAPNIWWSMLRAAEDQLATYTSMAIRAGLEERRVRVAESVGTAVIGVLRAVAIDVLNTLQQAGLQPTLVDLFRSTFDDAAHRHLSALRRPEQRRALPAGPDTKAG